MSDDSETKSPALPDIIEGETKDERKSGWEILRSKVRKNKVSDARKMFPVDSAIIGEKVKDGKTLRGVTQNVSLAILNEWLTAR